GRQLGQANRSFGPGPQAGRIDLVEAGAGVALPERDLHRDLMILRLAAGADLAPGEAGEGGLVGAQLDEALGLGCGAGNGGEQLGRDLLGVLGFEHGEVWLYEFLRVLVLRMFTLENFAGGHPWLTALICSGSPLPSPIAP